MFKTWSINLWSKKDENLKRVIAEIFSKNHHKWNRRAKSQTNLRILIMPRNNAKREKLNKYKSGQTLQLPIPKKKKIKKLINVKNWTIT
jgi:hypothetical protein